MAASRWESVYQKPVKSRRVAPGTPAASTYRPPEMACPATSHRRERRRKHDTAPRITSAARTQPAPRWFVAPVSTSPSAWEGDSKGTESELMGPANTPHSTTTSQYAGAASTMGAANKAAAARRPARYRPTAARAKPTTTTGTVIAARLITAFGCEMATAVSSTGASSHARPRPITSSLASPAIDTRTATPAGTRESPSRLGQRMPQPSSSHGNAPNATLSRPARPSAARDGPASCRISRTQPRGQTTSAMVTERMFAAAGTELPVIMTNSDPRSCQPAG
jgi:hypothetical protein